MISEMHIRVAAEIEEVVSNFLLENGSMGSVVDVAGGTEYPLIKGYFQAPDKEQLTLQLQLLLVAHGVALADAAVQWFSLEEKDWANSWKEHIKPVATGKRLLILPSWLEQNSSESQRSVLRMDPEMAFGSGSHETTRGCLEALEIIADNGSIGHLLDVGTGSGILAIGAVLLGAKQVTAFDNDIIAVETALKNCKINQVDSKINLVQAEKPPVGQFSTIVANILADVLVGMREPIVEALAPTGTLILSGILDTQGAEVTAAYIEAGLQQTNSLVMGEWMTLVFIK